MKIFFLKAIGLFFLLLTLSFANLSNEVYVFKNQQQQQQFQYLSTSLRCLVCQNESLADSEAPLAMDLKKNIYKKIQQGKTNQEIIDYLVSRYGDYILYKPPLQGNTYILWFAPFIFLLVALSIFFMVIRGKRNKNV